MKPRTPYRRQRHTLRFPTFITLIMVLTIFLFIDHPPFTPGSGTGSGSGLSVTAAPLPIFILDTRSKGESLPMPLIKPHGALGLGIARKIMSVALSSCSSITSSNMGRQDGAPVEGGRRSMDTPEEGSGGFTARTLFEESDIELGGSSHDPTCGTAGDEMKDHQAIQGDQQGTTHKREVEDGRMERLERILPFRLRFRTRTRGKAVQA